MSNISNKKNKPEINKNRCYYLCYSILKKIKPRLNQGRGSQYICCQGGGRTVFKEFHVYPFLDVCHTLRLHVEQHCYLSLLEIEQEQHAGAQLLCGQFITLGEHRVIIGEVEPELVG